MVGAALLSTFHLLALAIGLPSVVLRGRALKRLQTSPAETGAVLAADNVWGLAALLWIGTGLARVFGGFEKGSTFYLNSGAFWLKMALLAGVFLLELWPMATFIRWRIREAKGLPIDTSSSVALWRVNALEVGLTLAMPFVASLMARGLGFTWFS